VPPSSSTKTPLRGWPVRGFCLALIALGTLVAGAEAQSEYHWSDQFGNRSTLLNGTMIGSVSDLGAAFYNPGRLAQLDRAGFLLTAEAFEMNFVEVEGGTGENPELEQSNFRGVPSLIAGLFSLSFLPGHKFAYSFLARRRSQSDLLWTTEAQEDLIAQLPGEESYLGSWESAGKVTENWVGITWAHEITPRISLGLSTFGTYVGRNQRIELDVRTVHPDGDPSAFIRSREYRFKSYGLLWKAGLAADFETFRAGLSITTPSIKVLGDGSIRYEDLLTAPDLGEIDPNVESQVTVSREEGLPVATHSPLAVGGGISWVGDRAEVHLSGEWYFGVPEYQIMAVDSVRSQSSGELAQYRVMDELKQVFNYGVGIEWQVSDVFSVYGSAAWEESAAPADVYEPFAFETRISNSIAQADAFHLGSGVSLETPWIDLTTGISFSSMTEAIDNPLIFSGLGANDPIPVNAELTLEKRRWRFLFGFSIPIVETDG
jgi:hypothetical protein